MTPDDELLRRYVAEKSDATFAVLVQRYLPLVYATALRQVGGDAHLAHDVAQVVFTALARKAPSLLGRATLAGWLYLGANHASAQAVRAERRRQTREQTAHAMQHLHSPAETSADWARVQPAIDEALRALNDADREAVLLRFFERRPFAEIGAGLRISEDAARMRVERALEKLRAALGRRGITSTAAALSAALASPAAAAAALPAGLAAGVTQAALAGAAVQGTVAGGLLLGFMSTNKIIAGAAVIVALLSGIVAYREHGRAEALAAATTTTAAATQGRLDTLTAQLARANQRVGEADKDNDSLLKAIAAQKAQPPTPPAPVSVNPVQTAAPTVVGPVVGGILAMNNGNVVQPDPNTNPEQVAHQRTYMQEAARVRRDEAMQRAKAQDDAALDRGSPNPSRFDLAKLVDGANQLLARGDIDGAIALFQTAIRTNPEGEPLPEAVTRGLQEALKIKNASVEVTLVSDGVTWVGFSAMGMPRPVPTLTMRLPGGNYEAIGLRTGYETVRIPFQIRPGTGPQRISVVCTVPAGKTE